MITLGEKLTMLRIPIKMTAKSIALIFLFLIVKIVAEYCPTGTSESYIKEYLRMT